jgi:hypothetical protein
MYLLIMVPKPVAFGQVALTKLKIQQHTAVVVILVADSISVEEVGA